MAKEAVTEALHPFTVWRAIRRRGSVVRNESTQQWLTMPNCGDRKGHVQVCYHLPDRFADRGRVRSDEHLADRKTYFHGPVRAVLPRVPRAPGFCLSRQRSNRPACFRPGGSDDGVRVKPT